MKYRILTIVANLLASKPSSSEDEAVAGEYSVEVNSDLPDDKAASVALDIFHSNIAVDVLDDFEFVVKDGERTRRRP